MSLAIHSLIRSAERVFIIGKESAHTIIIRKCLAVVSVTSWVKCLNMGFGRPKGVGMESTNERSS